MPLIAKPESSVQVIDTRERKLNCELRIAALQAITAAFVVTGLITFRNIQVVRFQSPHTSQWLSLAT